MENADVIADSLINGDDPAALSQDDLAMAKDVLVKRKENFINEGNIEEVRKIQGIMEKISQLEKQKKTVSKKREVTPLPKLSKNSPKSENEGNNASFSKETVDKLVSGEITYDEVETKDISELISETKKIVKELSGQRKLIEAQKYEDVSIELSALNTQRKSDDKTLMKETNLENQIGPVEQSINDKKKELDEKIQKYDEETQKTVSETEEANQKKYNEFDEETAKNEPKEVKRPSPELLNIKKKADYLIQLRRFAEAAQYDQEAEQLGKVELENAISNYNNERKVKKEQIISEDNEKLRIFKAKRENRRNEMIRDCNKEIERLEKTANNLKGKHQSKPRPKIPPLARTQRTTPFATQRLMMPLGRRPATSKMSRRSPKGSNKL